MLVLHPLRPNCAITIAALFLDIGIDAEHAGVALAIMMSHVFLGHALEAAAQDGARLHGLPADAVEYRGEAVEAQPERALTDAVPRPRPRAREAA